MVRADEDTTASVAHAHTLSRAFRQAADRATPAVVAISVKMAPAMVGHPKIDGLNDLPPEIRRFFDQFGGGMQMQPFQGDSMPRQAEGTGSGVIIDPRGIVLTNNHVVQNASEVMVQLADGRTFKGSAIKTDRLTDLAIFTIEGAKDLTAIPIGKSNQMEIGDWVIAIGSPFELHHTVSAGIISGKGRSLSAASRSQFLQTDAAINPGNSGGPLVNLEGELIGINTAIASRSGGYNGIGFAIPSETVSWVTEQLLDEGVVQRAYLGVQIQEMTDALGKQFNIPRRGGVIVSSVLSDSPGDVAGLIAGDVITHFGGVPVKTPSQLQSTVERSAMDTPHIVRVIRDGDVREITVSLDALPTARQLSARRPPSVPAAPTETVTSEKLGLTVGPDRETGDGVKILRVMPGSLAARGGIRPGGTLQSIDRQPVVTPGKFAAVAEEIDPQKGVMLQIRTANGSEFTVLRGGD
tara:strand:+ start:940 stop:2337 length:1398 start_codon:yes stop_codon:yes gene_type:complete